MIRKDNTGPMRDSRKERKGNKDMHYRLKKDAKNMMICHKQMTNHMIVNHLFIYCCCSCWRISSTSIS